MVLRTTGVPDQASPHVSLLSKPATGLKFQSFPDLLSQGHPKHTVVSDDVHLNPNSITKKTRLGVVAQTCHQGTQEFEAGVLRVKGQTCGGWSGSGGLVVSHLY